MTFNWQGGGPHGHSCRARLPRPPPRPPPACRPPRELLYRLPSRDVIGGGRADVAGPDPSATAPFCAWLSLVRSLAAAAFARAAAERLTRPGLGACVEKRASQSSMMRAADACSAGRVVARVLAMAATAVATRVASRCSRATGSAARRRRVSAATSSSLAAEETVGAAAAGRVACAAENDSSHPFIVSSRPPSRSAEIT